ncbi:MAG TPA: amino acid ABC transporter permease [Bacillota bacterium]|nr:amino acid ABC transporter permease [Bacillota bacterium]
MAYSDLSSIQNLLTLLSKGAVVSLEIFFLTLICSVPLGLVLALGRMSRSKWLSWVIRQYILFMRGTPLILQIMIVYFVPPSILPEGLQINLDRFVAAVVAFSLNYAAYFAEIFRGGFLSIPQGQYEAAQVLGFSRSQTFFRIILPQVTKRILPPTSNEVITLVKDTALATVLGISELFRAAKDESSRAFSATPLFVAGLFYLVMNFVVERMFYALEKRLSYYE